MKLISFFAVLALAVSANAADTSATATTPTEGDATHEMPMDAHKDMHKGMHKKMHKEGKKVAMKKGAKMPMDANHGHAAPAAPAGEATPDTNETGH